MASFQYRSWIAIPVQSKGTDQKKTMYPERQGHGLNETSFHYTFG